jgi:hypothetical protein
MRLSAPERPAPIPPGGLLFHETESRSFVHRSFTVCILALDHDSSPLTKPNETGPFSSHRLSAFPYTYASLAPFKVEIEGSNPSGGTI